MTGALKPYPAMKDSGLPWLGEVPEHWEEQKLRNILRAIAIRNRSDLPLLSVVREKGVILRDVTNQDENHNFIPDDLTNYKVVRSGQFAMNKMKAWQGSYGVSSFEGIVSPAYYVFDLSGVSARYFHTAIRSRAYVPFFTQASDGVRIGQWDLSQARMREIQIFVPPLAEQAAIVRYLDHVDRRIRRYIRAKQKLIKLLEEQKQAIIHRAVTRGLDPNVRLKPSGVEWLGDVPEHWEVVALKRACSLVRDGTHLPPPRVSTGVPLLSVRNIIDDEFKRRDDDSMISEPDYYQLCRSFVPHTDDVLLAIVGATLGKVAVVPPMERFHIQRSLAIFRTNQKKLSHRFLAAYLRAPAFQRALWTTVAFSAQPGIYLSTLGNFAVLLPPVDEQDLIVSRLGAALRDLQSSIRMTRKEIDHLLEYRTRLIADVVTGKVDVREVAACLPDEIEEQEPLEETEAGIDVDADAADELDGVSEEAEA